MLIKIRLPNSEGFQLIDNAENVLYTDCPINFSSWKEISEKISFDSPIADLHYIVDFDHIEDERNKEKNTPETMEEVPTPPVYFLAKITYTRNGEEFTYLFDTVAYICNDNGQTLEKVCALEA